MIRDFTVTVADLDDGEVLAQLTTELCDLIKAVTKTNKVGTLTLRLKVKPDGRKVEVTADVSSKQPRPATGTSLFFADDDGNLHREDPKQPALRGLEQKKPTPLRTIKENPEAPKGA